MEHKPSKEQAVDNQKKNIYILSCEGGGGEEIGGAHIQAMLVMESIIISFAIRIILSLHYV